MNKPLVFLSHASADKGRIKPLALALIKEGMAEAVGKKGFRLFIDKPHELAFGGDFLDENDIQYIQIGEYWDDEIRAALDKSSVVVICLSSSFLTSRHLLDNELTYGLMQNKLATCIVDGNAPKDLAAPPKHLVDFKRLQSVQIPLKNRSGREFVEQDEVDALTKNPDFQALVSRIRSLLTSSAEVLDDQTSTPRINKPLEEIEPLLHQTSRVPGEMQVIIDRGWHPLASGFPPEWADGWGQDQHGVFTEVLIGEVEFRLRWSPPGRFLIGSPEGEPGRTENEGPQTEITIADGFWIMDAPVTQALWEAMGRENPSRFVSPERPVENVSWEEAKKFCSDLTERLPKLTLGLPSEAQWEYACRGDVPDATFAGPMEILGANDAPVLNEIAWYGGNSGVGFDLEGGVETKGWPEKAFDHTEAGSRLVRLQKPNPWGCYEMLGNVWEWCEDAWAESHDGIDSTGAPRPVSQQETDQDRVVRGGSWGSSARVVRAAYRRRAAPELRSYNLGFRCASVQASPASQGGQDDRPSEGEAEPPSDASAKADEFSAQGSDTIGETNSDNDAPKNLKFDIYVSHSHENADLARRVVSLLKDAGLAVSFSAEISAGTSWQNQIEEIIGSARCVLSLYSEENSMFFEAEAAQAEKRGNWLPILRSGLVFRGNPEVNMEIYEPTSIEEDAVLICKMVQRRLS